MLHPTAAATITDSPSPSPPSSNALWPLTNPGGAEPGEAPIVLTFWQGDGENQTKGVGEGEGEREGEGEHESEGECEGERECEGEGKREGEREGENEREGEGERGGGRRGSELLEAERAIAAAGVAIAPLRSVDEVAAFFLAAASVPLGVLNRAAHVAARCSERLLACIPMVETALERIGLMPHVERLIYALPPTDGTLLRASTHGNPRVSRCRG